MLMISGCFCIRFGKLNPEPHKLSYLNVGTGIDMSIRDLAESVASVTGYEGGILG